MGLLIREPRERETHPGRACTRQTHRRLKQLDPHFDGHLRKMCAVWCTAIADINPALRNLLWWTGKFNLCFSAFERIMLLSRPRGLHDSAPPGPRWSFLCAVVIGAMATSFLACGANRCFKDSHCCAGCSSRLAVNPDDRYLVPFQSPLVSAFETLCYKHHVRV